MNQRVLMLVTGHNVLGSTESKTGTYLPELTDFYEVLKHEGYQVEVASPRGGQAPVDPSGLSATLWPFLPLLQQTHAFAQVQATDFDAFFLVGGHGVMWDLPEHPALIALLEHAASQDKVLAAVCHGPAGLLHLTTSGGRALVDGKQVTGFSNEEEEAMGLSEVVPFLLEDALRGYGGLYTSAPAWQPHVVTDGTLITEQNPASARGVAQAVCALLRPEPKSKEEEVAS
ncbi:dimethylallyltransferase [Reticulibacter mediterranei]|uniref:Dimethylallyltransferase n=1 Tax=Reticulibacter mediterranei TaxID=2778369 RepID=A0A8J3IUD4_9CHLR|nr:type 1 glutamine amidotransferase domain-containing protein [Reticulibacter mediterranei]GHO98690.1 dimethylallyltransferase [Reticulibacter mediterranei]